MLPVDRFQAASLPVRLSVIVAYLAVVAAAAVATFHLVEEPARKWLRKRPTVKPSTGEDNFANMISEPVAETVNA